ncbi:hypothetical protein TNCV_3547511 [Trichonephila clavipes]|nr:hypothetical protein TNCV_3547511 [Trichonephila clavipes]
MHEQSLIHNTSTYATPTYTNSESPPLNTDIQEESVTEPDDIDNFIEENVDLARQIHLEVDSDDVQELLDSYNQEITIDELIEMHEQLSMSSNADPVQSEDRMTVVRHYISDIPIAGSNIEAQFTPQRKAPEL